MLIRIFFYFFILLIISTEFAQSIKYLESGNSVREKISLNNKWKFYLADSVDNDINFVDNSLWENINLPHTWNANDTFIKLQGYMRGIGWYQKELNVFNLNNGKRYYLFLKGLTRLLMFF